jgi:high-affinity K+ transport system ATPase subunit B
MPKQVLITKDGYEGKYVAMRSMSDRTIIASGDNPDAVMNQAHEKGITDPLIFFVPNRDITLVY